MFLKVKRSDFSEIFTRADYMLDVLKPVRGSSLPLKVEVSSNHNNLKDATNKKRKAFDRTFNAERGYVWHIRMQGLPGKSLDQTRILY